MMRRRALITARGLAPAISRNLSPSAQQNSPGVGAIIAEDDLQDGRFADAGRAVENDALAPRHRELHLTDHRQP